MKTLLLYFSLLMVPASCCLGQDSAANATKQNFFFEFNAGRIVPISPELKNTESPDVLNPPQGNGWGCDIFAGYYFSKLLGVSAEWATDVSNFQGERIWWEHFDLTYRQYMIGVCTRSEPAHRKWQGHFKVLLGYCPPINYPDYTTLADFGEWNSTVTNGKGLCYTGGGEVSFIPSNIVGITCGFNVLGIHIIYPQVTSVFQSDTRIPIYEPPIIKNNITMDAVFFQFCLGLRVQL